MNLLSRAGRHETMVLLVVLLLATGVGSVNPAFFTFYNMFSLLKNSTVIGFFAIGFFLVLVVGGLDVSFAAIGVFAMYATVKIALALFPEAPFVVLCVVAATIGAGFGLINGLLVTQLKAPSLIVTLGTLSLYRGFLLYFVGTETIRQVPRGMTDFARANIVTMTAANGAKVGLHVSVLIFLLTIVAVFLFFASRSSDGAFTQSAAIQLLPDESASTCQPSRSSPTPRPGCSQVLPACSQGACCVSQIRRPWSVPSSMSSLLRCSEVPQSPAEREASSECFSACFLIVITENSLIVLGIPATWQKVAIGLLLLAAVGLPLLTGGGERAPLRKWLGLLAGASR